MPLEAARVGEWFPGTGTQAPLLLSSTALVARCRCQQDTNHSGSHSDGGREAEEALLVLAGEGEAFLEHSHRLLEKYRKKENDESDNISSKL